jgi:GxxExxY protein
MSNKHSENAEPAEVAELANLINREVPAGLNDLAHAVIGAAIEVHRRLGPGFVEAVYEVAMLDELRLRAISVRQQVVVPIEYKDVVVGSARIDLLVEGVLVLELKATESVIELHRAQLLSYLKAGGYPLG